MRMLIRRRDRGSRRQTLESHKVVRGFGNEELDGEFGTVSVMNERQVEKRSAKIGSA